MNAYFFRCEEHRIKVLSERRWDAETRASKSVNRYPGELTLMGVDRPGETEPSFRLWGGEDPMLYQEVAR